MNICVRIDLVTLAAGIVLAGVVQAHEPAVPAGQATAASTGMPVFVQNVAPEAADAVKVVDAFSAAVKAAKLDDAAKLLDPNVLILESGRSERSRDEYMRSHAIADAAYMQSAEQVLRYRQARVDGNMAWIGTESEIESKKNGKTDTLWSTETMVLKKSGEDWRIVHIHWSSRPASKTLAQPVGGG